MTVLGLSFGFHDATAAIVANGRLLAAVSEERLSLQKHDSGFPHGAIQSCLKQTGLSLADIDQVAFYENPEDKFTRILTTCLANFPKGQKEWRAAMGSWLGQKIWTRAMIAKKLALPFEKIVCLDHHQSHAAQAFLGSGMQRSAVVIVDAVGEWSCTSIWLGDRKSKEPVKKLAEQRYPHSLGLFYSAMTAYLGFKPMNDECSVMALAAFGRPILKDFFTEELLRIDDHGSVNLNSKLMNFNRFLSAPWTKDLINIIGSPRDARENLSVSSFEDPTKPTMIPGEQRFLDIAASVQAAYTEVVLRLVRRASDLCQERKICMAGGGALNCVTNQSILSSGLVDNLFIPADPGDGGAAVGAAMLADFLLLEGQAQACNSNHRNLFGPINGKPSLEEDQNSPSTLGLVAQLKPSRFRAHALSGYDPGIDGRFRHELANSDEELVEKVAAALAAGNVIGWMQGPSELGPRALGGRSLLFRPDSLELAKRVSTQIKHRAPYRPYALSMTQSNAKELIEGYDAELIPFRWMQLTAPIQKEKAALVRAGLHSDGTTRPQVVAKEDNPLFHDLLQAFHKQSGLPALVNTSFNESGFPIVEKPVDAALMFVRTAIDWLVVGREILIKERVEA